MDRDDTLLPDTGASGAPDDPAADTAEVDGWAAADLGGAASPTRPKRHRLRIALAVIAGLLVMALVASLFIRVPYYVISPGSLRATEPLVSVDEARAYPPEEGVIDYLTVSTRPARVLTALLGWLDKDSDVVDEDLILGTSTPAENRTQNLQAMDESVDVAAEVAFEHLGFDVESGTGAIVAGVAPDLPVADVLKPGDVIVAIDDEPTATSDDARLVIRSHEPGDEITLHLENAGEDGGGHMENAGEDGEGPVRERTETVALAARPDDEDIPLLGVDLGTRDRELDLPFPVDIDTGAVGGPSAGLAFTLAVLDVLTPGEITGGAEVAVTGTIDGVGTVGPIGGIAQKAAAVRESGADVFIVPAVQAEQARAHAGDVEVVGVETLDDALEVLDGLGGNALNLEPPDVDQPATS